VLRWGKEAGDGADRLRPFYQHVAAPSPYQLSCSLLALDVQRPASS
jgi:hypothetical protein